jgi:hypothetical protein
MILPRRSRTAKPQVNPRNLAEQHQAARRLLHLCPPRLSQLRSRRLPSHGEGWSPNLLRGGRPQ